MSTGYGKNFLAGSLVDQHYYFDEVEDRVQFPAMFPVALLSCTLLEKAKQDNVDWESNSVSCRSGHGAAGGDAAGCRPDMKTTNMAC